MSQRKKDVSVFFTMKKIIIFLILLFPVISFSEDLNNYLILGDIGAFKYRPRPTKRIYGNSGVLISAGHFFLDHDDVTYQTRYIQPEPLLGVEVQVTQHVGSDSDRWLLHEVEDAYRSSGAERLGLLTKGARLREINGNKFISLRGSGYSWINNNVVVEISYTDMYGNKPEPLEIIQAYLQKFPSTILSALVLDRTHDEQWIKDEMERRLWLCGKWFVHLESDRSKLNSTLKTTVDHIAVFLNYRDKYYGISAKDDGLVLMGYLSAENETGIKSKLTEYRIWWNANKTKAINLP